MKNYNPSNSIRTSRNFIAEVIRKNSDTLSSSQWLNYGAGRFPEKADQLVENGYHYDPFMPDDKAYQQGNFSNNRSDLDNKSFSFCVVANVLNVLPDTVLLEVLTDIKSLQIDTLLISVYEGDRTGKHNVTKHGTFQRNEKAIDYIVHLKNVFSDKYSITRKGDTFTLTIK